MHAFTTTSSGLIGVASRSEDYRERLPLRMSNFNDGNSHSNYHFDEVDGPFGKNKAKGGPRQFLTQVCMVYRSVVFGVRPQQLLHL